MFSHHNEFKLEINNRKLSGKFLGIWKWSKTFLNNPGTKEKNESRKYFELNEKRKHIILKIVRYC